MKMEREQNDTVARIGVQAPWLLMALTVVTTILAILSAVGFAKARDAQHGITRLQLQQQSELQGKHIAEVTTCFTTARGRPKIVRIFSAIGGSLDDLVARQLLSELITKYRADTPTLQECRLLAEKYKLNPSDYDVTKPRGEAASG